MAKVVVPQFIDVEDKIIGPITTRQFIMGVVAGFFIFLSYKFADLALFIIEAIAIVGLYILLAFVKINGQHFHMFALSVVSSVIKAQLRIWKKIQIQKSEKSEQEESGQDEKQALVSAVKPRAKSQELSALSLMVDTGGKYRPEEILRAAKEKQKNSISEKTDKQKK